MFCALTDSARFTYVQVVAAEPHISYRTSPPGGRLANCTGERSGVTWSYKEIKTQTCLPKSSLRSPLCQTSLWITWVRGVQPSEAVREGTAGKQQAPPTPQLCLNMLLATKQKMDLWLFNKHQPTLVDRGQNKSLSLTVSAVWMLNY